MAAKVSGKPATPVTLDVMQPPQVFDASGAARTGSVIFQVIAKGAGAGKTFRLVNRVE